MTMREPELFSDFAPAHKPQSSLRVAITAAYRQPEPICVPPLVEAARVSAMMRTRIAQTARKLVTAVRAKGRGSEVDKILREYSLSSQEGVALMCLAEALLRIPDSATRDALIRDKISGGDWESHVGGGRSLFISAATWGLVITGRLTATNNGRNLSSALARFVSRSGQPVVRRAIQMAMRMLGEQFVTGETIEQALSRARSLEARGFRYSYDMLGEAATTSGDAKHYYALYEHAIHAIGQAAAGCGVYDGPGISIKLSALHPRYTRTQVDRVMTELLPRVKTLAQLAKSYDIGLNIDAEEADRLDLSLDLLEELCADPLLANWSGLGFVVQAYGKRCPFVIDYIIELAHRTRRRLMVRLVKGAYWDAEIKRAQLDGLDDYPVYTRKTYTDVAYIACAKKLLAARDSVFPQFATHNAQTLATIYHLADTPFKTGQYEFQCLHGMGEVLYGEVVGSDRLNRPCRIYAPVGTHETLLAYLVRRLLENGANSSFVNRISNPTTSLESLIADPAEAVASMPAAGAPHHRIASPKTLYAPMRQNSSGIDLSDEISLAHLSDALKATIHTKLHAAPILADGSAEGTTRAVLNPSDHRDVVGVVTELHIDEAPRVVRLAADGAKVWAAVAPEDRAKILERAADLLESRKPQLMGILVREAGKTATSAIGEVREAADFLRYYAAQARRHLTPAQRPLGIVVCISPWNFPLAIFTGQIAAALVAGNAVLAKPASLTPLIAVESVKILHEAGIPRGALQFTPGSGRFASAMIAEGTVAGVLFTGSTSVGRILQKQLAERLSPIGKPIPIIAETGGQNGMIVDSSALAEQVVADVITSAFDSAGQRCSALRVLCLQEEIADRILAMLKGALDELRLGRTDRLRNDVGPVIDLEAQRDIQEHIESMRRRGLVVNQVTMPAEAAHGTFVAPTIIEIDSISSLTREVFGPVLHVVRYARKELDHLIDEINSSGYGLTFGLHTRLDETVAHVTSRIGAGNLYINRNVIGAVVGVQPFGGRGLSGTGPKAGGPLYINRLVQNPIPDHIKARDPSEALLKDYASWLDGIGRSEDAAFVRRLEGRSGLARQEELVGPVGERNLYSLQPRGRILLVPETDTGLLRQIASAIAAGNSLAIDPMFQKQLHNLPETVLSRILWTSDWELAQPISGALVEGDQPRVLDLLKRIAALSGPLVLVQAASPHELKTEEQPYSLKWLLEEVSTSINTAAAGGNASLMTLDD